MFSGTALVLLKAYTYEQINSFSIGKTVLNSRIELIKINIIIGITI
jgi:hypothetical protein